jgi:hypothetical protein
MTSCRKFYQHCGLKNNGGVKMTKEVCDHVPCTEGEGEIVAGYPKDKRVLRRFFLMPLCILILAVGLSACGGGGSDDSSGSDSGDSSKWDSMTWDNGTWE